MNAQTPRERSGDNPSFLVETNNTNAMHACDMTLTYLSSGLSTCSVVWVSVQHYFPKVYQNFGATVQKILLRALKSTAHTFLSRHHLRFRTLFWLCASVALVCNLRFWTKSDGFQRLFVNV